MEKLSTQHVGKFVTASTNVGTRQGVVTNVSSAADRHEHRAYGSLAMQSGSTVTITSMDVVVVKYFHADVTDFIRSVM